MYVSAMLYLSFYTLWSVPERLTSKAYLRSMDNVIDMTFILQYTQIDDEHKVLFQSVFDVAAKPGDQKAVDRMYAVMNSHFANEEV